LRVGDVQGRPLNPNLGDTAGALASYTKSIALFESLAGAGGDASMQRERANAYVRMSEVLSSTGDTAKALEFAKKGLALQRESTGSAASIEARNALAATHSRVGDLLSATGDTRGALEERRRSLALMEAIAAVSPADPVTIRQLGVAYHKLGNSLGNPNYPNVGEFEGALEELEKSGAVFRKGVALHPNNAVFRRNLGIIDSNVADVLLALKRPAEALQRQLEARATFESLAAADPTNVAARDDVAISQSKIAEMLDANGRSKEAVGEFQRALAIHQQLAAADPQNRKFTLEVASDHNRLATAQMKVGLRAPSLSNHTSAVTMSRELSAANPGNVELRVAVALALTGRGDAWALFAKPPSATRAADLANAERDYREAVMILEKLHEEEVIGGTDVETLDNARKELSRIRGELGRGK
ncbi:MAG: hypothetical protein ACRD1U_12385, partial [Vicinamibacterales bacterium]